jgi:tetratricopeptide (TPR) repeat protein/transcriptional regulator with XRE-family HTH domain
MTELPATFAALLRKLRTDAGLTQEELAEAASVSPRAVSDLERGVNLTARKDTARLLAGALNLAGPAREHFEATARGRSPAVEESVTGVAAATRTLPRDIISFTGREPELTELVSALSDGPGGPGGVVGIHAIGGMAGIGKTAFAVHAAHRLAPRFPDGQIFLRLHGHTPGQRPADPSDALASLLLTAGVAPAQIPPGLEARMALWRDRLAGKQLLLVLDDAVGSEQVRPLLPGSPGSLVLVTSRRHLTALEDARAISLDTLPPAEAAGLLVRLAARPGLDPGDSSVAEIAGLCGYLPLAIGMLARQLYHHPAWTAADLAADLAAARDRLELMTTENVSVAAALDLSYQDLTEDQQRLLRLIGALPGTDLDVYAAAALAGVDLTAARRLLTALYDHYLLAEPVRGRYRPHDLIREHARAIAATDPAADTGAAMDRLLGYYLATARAADRHLALRTVAAQGVAMPDPAHAPRLATAEEASDWMAAERLNLHAAFGYAAAHGRPGYAVAVAAAMNGFLRQRHWSDGVRLHRAAAEVARQAGDRHAEAAALSDLGQLQDLTADYDAGAASLTRARELYRQLGDRPGEARMLEELGVLLRLTGDYAAASASLTEALGLFRGLGDRLGEADTLHELGSVRHRTGDFEAATASHADALEIYRELGYLRGEAWTLNSLGILQYGTGDYPAATDSLTRALELQRRAGNRLGEANTTYELGTVRRLTADYAEAVALQRQALALYRDLGYGRGEANVLTELGTVLRLTGDGPAAAAHQQQALELYRRVGDRLGEGVVLDELGELALSSASTSQAGEHFAAALAIAVDMAAPPEQARALAGIGRSQLRAGQPDQAAVSLGQALEIYRRIGSPEAERIRQILRDHGIRHEAIRGSR